MEHEVAKQREARRGRAMSCHAAADDVQSTWVGMTMEDNRGQ